MLQVRKRAAIVVATLTAVVLALLVANGRAVVAYLLPRIASLASGYQVRVAQTLIGASQAQFDGIRVSRSGEPVFSARRIDVRYSLRDLLPGSTHRYGITAVVLDRPSFTLVRHRDGSYNIAFPPPSTAVPPPSPVNHVPLRLTLRIIGGAAAIRAPGALDPQARNIAVHDVNLNAAIDEFALTHYTLSGAFAGAANESFAAKGTIDVARGYAMHHLTATGVPMSAIANFFINSDAAHILGGTARNVDLRLYSLDVHKYQPVHYHLGATLEIADVGISTIGLAEPVTNLHGKLQVIDGAFFTNGIDGDLLGEPLHVSGGVYDFAHPQFRFGVSGNVELATLRHAFTFMDTQPLSGSAAIHVQIEGPIDSPKILASVRSPLARYDATPLERVHAVVAYSNGYVYFSPLEAHARGADLQLTGALATGPVLHSELMLHVRSPADSLPYAGEFLGSEPLAIDILLNGHDSNFYAYGALASTRGISRAAAVVHMDPSGVLDVAPLHMSVGHGSFDAAYHLDRAHDRSAFWLLAQHLVLHAPRVASPLAAQLSPFPPIDGEMSASIVGGGPSGNHTLIAGTIDMHDATISGVALDRVHARLAGTLAASAIDPVTADGPWGHFTGIGRFSFSGIAVRGLYSGTLQGLRPFMQGIPASGRIKGIASLAVTGAGIDVQAEHLQLQDASVNHIPLTQFSGTLAVRGPVLRVYSAHAHAAGGDVVAAGSYGAAPARADAISLVASGLDGPQLRGLGLPLDAGTLNAEGTLSPGAPIPSFDGGVALANGRVQQYHVAGSGQVAIHGDGARLANVLGSLAGTYAYASGTLSHLTSRSPGYDVRAEVPAGNITTVLRTLGEPAFGSDGTFNAALRVSGNGLNPRVTGPLNVPAGSINGLPYLDARAMLDASPTGVIMRDGHVLVGSTELSFGAGENPHISGVRVRTNKTDLSDFNNFFDTGDTLDGDGSLRFDVISQRHRISSNGAIDIADFRYHDLPIGDTKATWSSRRNTITGSLAVGGSEGTLRARGTISAQPSAQWQRTLEDSRYDLSFDLDNLDLSTAVSALGFPQVPITGRLRANATVNGRYPNLNLRGTTSLANGTIWRLPIESAQLSFHASGTRFDFDRGALVAPGITATTSGSIGFRANEPLNVQVYANSNDVPRLVAQLFRIDVPVSGDFESTLHIGGTLAKPAFDAAFDASNANVYGLKIVSAFGSLSLGKNTVYLRNAGVQFERGQITLAGSAPISLKPLQFGPRNAPVGFDLAVTGLDPAVFDSLVGGNTQFGGSIDGALGIDGTVGTPRIAGRFGITRGSYVSDYDRAKISDLTGTLVFNQTQAAVQSFSAKMGTGTIGGAGQVVFPHGFENASAGGAAFSVRINARGAQIDSPTYGRGSIDAALELQRAPGEQARVSGDATLNDATIPFAAFIAAANGQAGTSPLPPLALGFDLKLSAGRNVAVRGAGYGAGLDIGAAGSAVLGGSLAAPTMDGEFHSTGGTLTYFDRAFRVQQATVLFRPENGIVPTLHATGITHVVTPTAQLASNPYGAADVTINVDGPIDALKIAFDSNPPGYTRDQILAMIAPFGGLISGVPQSQVGQPSINGTTPLGALSPVPGAAIAQGPNGTVTVGQEAFNILNAQFSAGLLSPFENALQQGLGLQSIALSVDYYGNVGVTASRLLGKTVSFIYGTTFGIQNRQTVGLQLLGRNGTSAQLSGFFQNGPVRLFETPGAGFGSGRLEVGQPVQGQSGFSFTLQRSYW
jgi:autotransporter translocation and assembly factor TamB